MRLINATKAEERIVALYRKEHGVFADTFNTAVDACQSIVLDMYDNDFVEERKKGEWILLDECLNSGYYCSECNKKVIKEGWSDTVKKINYCPNCGADLRGEQE